MFGDQGNDNKNTEYAFDLGFLGIARLGWADCVHRAIDGKGRAAGERFLSGPFARSPFALRPHVDNAYQLLLGVDRELLVDMLDVRSRRGPRDAQFRRYGIGMIAFGEQHKDFGFTWGQAVRLGDRIASITKAPAWDFAPFSGLARNRMLIVGVVVGA